MREEVVQPGSFRFAGGDESSPGEPSPLGVTQGGLELVRIEVQLVLNAEDSPTNPYAMEYVKVSAFVRNAGIHLIPKEDVLDDIPQFDLDDFVVIENTASVPDEGFLNIYAGRVQSPGQTAEVQVYGYFESAGRMSIKASMNSGSVESVVDILEDVGCFDSDGGVDEYVKGWIIGTSACVHQNSCMSSSRLEDSCDGNSVKEYICALDPDHQVMRTYYGGAIVCENGCFDGACQSKEDADARILENPPAPLAGKYRLIDDFSMEGCGAYGCGFEGGECCKRVTKTFKAGDIIDVENFFWNGHTKEWGAKVVVHWGVGIDQIRSIPVRFIKPLK
jgi:hypothetical protein